jgi:hypothetical protein
VNNADITGGPHRSGDTGICGICETSVKFCIIIINNHPVLCYRVLYRQRFFQTVPKLVEHYHHAAEPVRCNFLIALAYMLQGVPRVVLTMSLPEVSIYF